VNQRHEKLYYFLERGYIVLIEHGGFLRIDIQNSHYPAFFFNGTTISLWDLESQAIWPGKACTSGTTSASPFVAQAKQTPWPLSI